MTGKVRIGINGYGTIGKRITDAINAQDDMEVVGVTKTRPSYEARVAIKENIPLYAAADNYISAFNEAHVEINGTLEDLLKTVDLMVDCTPSGIGARYAPLYKSAGVKAIFQGGEKHSIAGISFNAMANYKEAWGADAVRVVSCNTTGLCRTLYPIQKVFGIERVLAVMIRRSADPGDVKGGPLNAIVPVLKVPSHHGPDLQTVVPEINIQTMAVMVPTTIMHMHAIMVFLSRKRIKADDILAIWDKVPRVKFVSGEHGIKSSAQIMELARDLNRKRGDFNEIIIWVDGTHIKDDILYYYQAVHQESDVIPEIVDCIRAMMELEEDPNKSIIKTDYAMGINK